MDLGLSGRSALITASSGGIGLSVARALAREGCDVVLFARSHDKLEAAADGLRRNFGGRVLPVVGSLLDPSDRTRVFDEIERQFGRLDIAVLNTGRPPSPLRAASDETDKSRWDQSYEGLLASVIDISQRCLPMMGAARWGRLIAITSASVHLAMPHHALSSVFRAGLEAYVRHLASEVGSLGITANCVAPALIDSSHRETSVAYTPEQTARRREMSALKRFGTHQELSGVVAFLASEQAGFVTGESVRVDGGMAVSALHR